MASNRPSIPKTLKEEVLREYSHRCAVCGGDSPQVHHIDGDNSNNVAYNLIPLCPNHHLIDQHNPTKKIDTGLLKLFRIYKDPTILSPQFKPIFDRSQFQSSLESFDFEELCLKSSELIKFVSCLEMGNYYSEKLQVLMEHPKIYRVLGISSNPWENEQQEIQMKADKLNQYNTYIAQLKKNSNEITRLLVELLRYQKWRVE